MPWHTRIAGGEIDRVGVSAEPARPDFHRREHEAFSEREMTLQAICKYLTGILREILRF